MRFSNISLPRIGRLRLNLSHVHVPDDAHDLFIQDLVDDAEPFSDPSNDVLNALIDVQPMAGPSAQVFYLDLITRPLHMRP